MTNTRFTSRRGLNVQKYQAAIQAELKKEHEKLAQETLKKFNDVVSDWKSEDAPKFRKRVYSANINRSGFGIYSEGDEHQTMIWNMLDTEGRKFGKIIRPKKKYETVQGKDGTYQRKSLLRFHEGYESKTWPVAQFGGSGERFGDYIRTPLVKQGAIKPRQFSVTIMDEFAKDEFLRRSKNAYQRAFDRAKAASK